MAAVLHVLFPIHGSACDFYAGCLEKNAEFGGGKAASLLAGLLAKPCECILPDLMNGFAVDSILCIGVGNEVQCYTCQTSLRHLSAVPMSFILVDGNPLRLSGSKVSCCRIKLVDKGYDRFDKNGTDAVAAQVWALVFEEGREVRQRTLSRFFRAYRAHGYRTVPYIGMRAKLAALQL